MVEELVLRWPRGLSRTLVLRPFEPSEQRIAEGGPASRPGMDEVGARAGEEGEAAGRSRSAGGRCSPARP